MTKHPGQIVREKVVAALRYKTPAQERVFEMIPDPWSMRVLPALAVYTMDETGEPANLDGDSDRRLTVTIQAVAQTPEDDNAGEVIDPFRFAIENAVLADPTLGGAAESTTYQTTHIEFDTSRRILVGAMVVFETQYTASAPQGEE